MVTGVRYQEEQLQRWQLTRLLTLNTLTLIVRIHGLAGFESLNIFI